LAIRQTGYYDVMFADSAECVYVGVIGVMIEVLVLFV
jgi:hypothetical protein